MKKGKTIFGIMIVSLLLISSLVMVSAGFWGDLFTFGEDNSDLEGELAQGGVHVANVTIRNEPPIICDLNGTGSPVVGMREYAGPLPSEGGFERTNLSAIIITVYDPNGITDLPNGTMPITATGYAELIGNTPYDYIDVAHTRRYFNGGDCVDLDVVSAYDNGCTTEENTFARRYLCNVSMYYYDDPAPFNWSVNVTSFYDLDVKGTPKSALESYFEPNVFSIASLPGYFTDSADIVFVDIPTVIRDNEGRNSTSPIIVKNTGNDNWDGQFGSRFSFIGENLTQVGGNLVISPDNFIVHMDDVIPCDDALIRITLQDDVPVDFPGLLVPNGDHENGLDAKNTTRYCMVGVNPDLESGSYSTAETGKNWVITS